MEPIINKSTAIATSWSELAFSGMYPIHPKMNKTDPIIVHMDEWASVQHSFELLCM